MRALRGMFYLYHTYNQEDMHFFMTVPLSPVWPVRGGPKCYGDCDGDGDVDGSDLALFMEDFLANNLEGPCSADFNEDGLVNEEDSARFATCLGRTDCPVLNGEQ